MKHIRDFSIWMCFIFVTLGGQTAVFEASYCIVWAFVTMLLLLEYGFFLSHSRCLTLGDCCTGRVGDMWCFCLCFRCHHAMLFTCEWSIRRSFIPYGYALASAGSLYRAVVPQRPNSSPPTVLIEHCNSLVINHLGAVDIKSDLTRDFGKKSPW